MPPTPEPELAATIEPFSEMVPLSSGVELHVLRWQRPGGPDPARRDWMLTHGLASNARLWDGVARRLAALGHRVVTVDQRGHGRSSKPDDGYDVITCADDLALLIGAVGLATPAVAGQSWGGNVVLELGHRHPGLVHQVVPVDGGFIDLQSAFPVWEDCARALAPPKLAGTRLEVMEGWLAKSAADWPAEGRAGTMANFEVRDDGTIAPWLTAERHLTVLRGLWEHRPSAIYPNVSTNVLLVPADTGDVNWTSSKSDAVEHAVTALPRGRAHWFRPAHHDVHAQHPALVADLLRRSSTETDFFAHPAIDTTHTQPDTETTR